MNDFFERFDPKSDCLKLSLDYIFYNFYGYYPCIRLLENCSSLWDVYHFLRQSHFQVRCQCNPLFFLNPSLAGLYLTNKMNRSSVPCEGKIAILTYSSAFELYGILDSWNHYICEISTGANWEIYDSYYKYIVEDYPNFNAKPLSHASILKKKTFQFVIWR